jgi:hypothetical protein
MNRMQKGAWFHLLIAVSLGLSCIAVITLSYIVGMPKAWYGAFFMLLTGLGYFINEDDKNKVQFDERDKLILQRSNFAGFWGFIVFFIIFATVTYKIVGRGGLVSVDILSIMAVGGVVAMLFVQSITIIAQYGSKEKNHE